MSEDNKHIFAMNSSYLSKTPQEEILSSCHLKWVMTFLLAYFGMRLIYFATNIAPFVPPDEVTHFGCIRIFSKVLLLPENSPASYEYGLVTNIPWLYYWIMGKLLAVNFFGLPDLLFLRFLNIPFAFCTVYFIWLMLRLLTDDRLTQILLLVALTNTLMFSFLSASVSYDNLANLLAAMAVYYLLAFFKHRSGNMLLASFLCQLAGSLTKISFLPLILILNILLILHEFRYLSNLPISFKNYIISSGKRGLGLTLLVIISFSLNFQLYGCNYIHYRKLVPEMKDVLPFGIAMQNRIEARNMIFTLFKEGRISEDQAVTMTAQINHPGDREDAVYLIRNYAEQKNNDTETLGPVGYIFPWISTMLSSTYGILAHLVMLSQGPILILFAAFLVVAIVGFIINFFIKGRSWLSNCLAVIACFYSIFLMYFVNYRTYLEFKSFPLALQGRYIFPVIGPIYVLSCYCLLGFCRGKNLRLAVALTISFIFIASEFPRFLMQVTPEWFAKIVE